MLAQLMYIFVISGLHFMYQVKSSQVAFNKNSDNRTSFTAG